jgi:hypothetical protein
MSRRLIGYDDITGLSTLHEYNPQTDETTIIHSGDSTPYLEENKRIANDDDVTKKGIKNGWWKYASIPPAVQLQWLINHGVDVYNKDHGDAVLKLINSRDYSYLKTTAKFHK